MAHSEQATVSLAVAPFSVNFLALSTICKLTLTFLALIIWYSMSHLQHIGMPLQRSSSKSSALSPSYLGCNINCLREYSESGRTAQQLPPNCVALDKVLFLVKTCSKNAECAVNMSRTWGRYAPNVIYASDQVFDAGKVPIFVAPTLTMNDTTGMMQEHGPLTGFDRISCLSTVHAIVNILQLKPDIPFEWLVVVDNDTFVNTVHLEKTLHRYNSSAPTFLVTNILQPITYFTSIANETTGVIRGGSTAAGIALSVGLMRRLRDECDIIYILSLVFS